LGGGGKGGGEEEPPVLGGFKEKGGFDGLEGHSRGPEIPESPQSQKSGKKAEDWKQPRWGKGETNAGVKTGRTERKGLNV